MQPTRRHTRSQPLSPGGFLSLETVTPSRRKRATRNASQATSETPTPLETHKEPTSSTHRVTRSRLTATQPATSDENEPTTQSKQTTRNAKGKTGTRRSTRKTKTKAKATEAETIVTAESANSETPELSSFESNVDETDDRVEGNADREIGTEATRKQAKLPESAEVKDVGTSTSQSSNKTRTRKKGSKKRSHCETSDDEQAKTKTSSNKRRNLGAARSASHAGISPASRRILTNPVPYSERLRRRTVESRQGRIRRTIFRLPQVVAQAEADRLTSPTEESEGSSRTEMPSTASQDVSDEKEHAIESASQSASNSQIAEAPQTPSKRWSIRGLIGSVPRSFARILPGWGAGDHSPKEPETPRPSSERITRTTLPDVSSISEGKVRQPLFSIQQPITTEEKQDDTPRDLSYSLFPPPIDRSRFLGTTSDAPKASAPVDEQPTANTLVSNKRRASGSNPAVVEMSDSTEDLSQQKTETPRIKKRKRSPTPEVIPNPPGVSYGMDMRYFTYSSSESEDESEEIPPAKRTRGNDAAVMHNMRSAIRSETGPSKKVRFDASPENTPSKTRAKARATDPYRGRQFVGMGDDSNVSTPPRIPVTYGDFPRRPGFVFNTEGTYGFDYSDDSESDEEVTSSSVAAPSDASTVNVESESQDHEPKELPPPAPTPRHASLPPSTPSKVDEEALAKARSQAEKYKPKTPSGLRMSSRYSSPLTASPLAASPMAISATNPPATTSAITAASPVTTSSTTTPTTTSSSSATASAITAPASTTPVTTSPPITSLMAAPPLTASVTASNNVSLSPLDDAFGTDRFARDAKWLYDLCPSGNLQEFQWPEKKNVQESLDLDISTDVLTHVFNDSEVDHTYDFFKSAFEEFTASLA